MEEKRISQEIELQSYLSRLVRDDMESRIAKLKLEENLTEEEKNDATADIEQQSVSMINVLLHLFSTKIGEFF